VGETTLKINYVRITGHIKKLPTRSLEDATKSGMSDLGSLHGAHWMRDGKGNGEKMVPGGKGILGKLNDSMEPTAHIYLSRPTENSVNRKRWAVLNPTACFSEL
jgi:hypothetical protein